MDISISDKEVDSNEVEVSEGLENVKEQEQKGKP